MTSEQMEKMEVGATEWWYSDFYQQVVVTIRTKENQWVTYDGNGKALDAASKDLNGNWQFPG